jgi:lipid-binding SYLF domain-containing protein
MKITRVGQLFYRFRAGAFTAAFAIAFCAMSFGQSDKITTAKNRITNSTEALDAIARLSPSQSIPAELLGKARVIAVFPNITKINLLFQKAMKGSGLASRRTEDGWGTPAFYQFAMIDSGWTTVESKSPMVVMLFMNDEAFKKDHVEIGNTVAGPVGELIADADKKRVEGASIIAYGLNNGKLIGVKIEEGESIQSGLAADNAMNKPVFGKKGTEVFWSKDPSPEAVPELKALQTALGNLARAK